jgi:NAD(P)-dependent dehydrogenase (short-subunit alcohol dehydrogenase family)
VEKIEGRTALVTGGASGIGLGIAEALLSEGARVVIADWDPASLEREVERLGDAAFGQILDVRERESWDEAKRASEAVFGPVDILINNAGVAPDWNEFADMPTDHWDRLIGIMLTGVYNGVHAFAAEFRERGEGHIINTASMNGLVARAGMGAYTAAKFGVVGLTEVLRAEMEPYGVGVSVLCPGSVRTNLLTGSENAAPDTVMRHAAAGMDPLVAGAHVIDAIRNNRLYVITHPHLKDGVAKRVGELVDAFDRAMEGLRTP